MVCVFFRPAAAVRRAKFVTQPLAPEINTLLTVGATATGSSDLSCRHDLLPHALSAAAAAGAAATTTAAAATGTATGTGMPALLTYTAATSSPQLSAGIKATATTAVTMADNSFIAAGVCGAGVGATTAATITSPAAGVTTTTAAATLSALLSSSGNVDIMEDEDEQERERSRYVSVCFCVYVCAYELQAASWL